MSGGTVVIAYQIIRRLFISRAWETQVNGSDEHKKSAHANTSEPHESDASHTIHNKGNRDEIGNRADNAVNSVNKQRGVGIKTKRFVDSRSVASFSDPVNIGSSRHNALPTLTSWRH